MFKIILGLKNMHPIEIDYVSKKNVESNIQKINWIKRERKHPQKCFV